MKETKMSHNHSPKSKTPQPQKKMVSFWEKGGQKGNDSEEERNKNLFPAGWIRQPF